MTPSAFFVGFLFVLAVLVWANARRRIANSGLPAGHVAYQDAGRRHKLARPLISRRYGLAGKPDYLVVTTEGVVPVEVKSHNCPNSGPYESDTAQLTAYCILVEDALGGTPKHGIIQYSNRSSRIEYSSHRRDRVLQIIDEMRRTLDSPTVHRSHTQRGRCRACGFRAVCEERIG